MRRQRGQTMVEFALVSPLLFLLVFGVIDFGRAIADYVALSHATFEGARAAALSPAAPSGSQLGPENNTQDQAASNAVIGVVQSQGGVLDPVSESQVNITFAWCPTSVAPENVTYPDSIECRTVAVTKVFTPFTPLLSNLTGTLNMSKTAMAVVQN